MPPEEWDPETPSELCPHNGECAIADPPAHGASVLTSGLIPRPVGESLPWECR
jgi:hypothetical protein